MTSGKKVVLDANILVRAVVGERVPDPLERDHRRARFYTPSLCCTEAETHLPDIVNRRRQVTGSPMFSMFRT